MQQEQIKCPKCAGECTVIHDIPESMKVFQKGGVGFLIFIVLCASIYMCPIMFSAFSSPTILDHLGSAVFLFLFLVALIMAVPIGFALIVRGIGQTMQETSYMCPSCGYLWRENPSNSL